MTKESQNIEWKQSWHDDYLKWICGFANAQGGRIFIGKDDAGVGPDPVQMMDVVGGIRRRVVGDQGAQPGEPIGVRW